MATKYPHGNIDWSTGQWHTHPVNNTPTTTPGNGDTADANGYTVTLDLATTPASGTLSGLTNSVNAGGFVLTLSGTNTYTINVSSWTGGNRVSHGILDTAGAAAGATLTINCPTVTNSLASRYGILHASTGTLAIVGTVAGGTGANDTYAIYNSSTGAVSVSGGNVSGGNNSSNYAIYNNSTGTITVSGTVTGGTGGTGCYGIYNVSTAAVNVTGDVAGGSATTAVGIYNNSTGAVTVNGSVYGGSGLRAYGIYNASTTAVVVNNGSIVDSAYTSALVGKSVWNPGTLNYYENLGGSIVAYVHASAMGLTPGILASGWVVDDVHGARVDCPTDKALTTSGNYGNPSAPLVGTVDLSLYTLISGVVAAQYVITGHDNYTGGSAGTYVAPVAAGYSALAPGFGAGGTTAGTLAAAKIRDATYGTLDDGSVLVAAGGTYVDPSNADVRLGVSVGVSPRAGTLAGVIVNSAGTTYSVGCLVSGTRYASGTVSGAGAYNANGVIEADGTYYTLASVSSSPYTAGHSAGYGDGVIAQYASDVSAVDGAKADIKSTRVLLGVTGMLNMSLYVLKTDVAGAVDVRYGVARYTGGPLGSCYVPVAGDVRQGVAVDATTGTLVPVATSKLVGDGGGFVS